MPVSCALSADASVPLLFHAAQSGRQTLDAAEGGGNPFASAFIELLARPGLTLADFPRALSDLTAVKSKGFQLADAPPTVEPAAWRFRPKPAGEIRAALVLVISNYSRSDTAPSLPGARADAARISRALEQAGFETQTVLDPDTAGIRTALSQFAKRSAAADIAILYTTGHGVEVDGNVHLLLGDYPVAQGSSALARHGVRLAEIAASVKARRANLVLYGGCRDNPLAK